MTTHALQIGGATFPLASSQFKGHLIDPDRHSRECGDQPFGIRWCISLRFARGRLAHEDAWEIAPIFETHSGFDPGIADWRDFAGRALRWHHACQSGLPVGNAYVYEHADIYEATLAFSPRDGDRFEIQWSGLCDVYATRELWERVPFRIAAGIVFEGVTVECRARESMADVARRLANFTDLGALAPPILKVPPDPASGIGFVLFRPGNDLG
jgi:hypothetical protein